MGLDFLTGCFGWQPTKLSGCSEKATRVCMWTVNLILIVPSAMAAFAARDNYLLMTQYPHLSQYPYHAKSTLAFLLTYIGCMTIFSWALVSSFLLKKWYGQWILFYGIINLGLAILLAIGVSMQAKFLPGTSDGCKGSKAAEWQVAPGYLSFFSLAAQLARNDATKAEAVCKSMVSSSMIAATTVFFQSLLAYVSVFFDEREHSLLNPFRPALWILTILIGPVLLFHDVVLPRIRLWLSYAKKGIAQLYSTKDLGVPLHTQFKPQYQSFDVPKTKLMNILAIEHVLLNIVDYTHHEDVVNLGLTCRAVRVAVYPPNDLDFRIPKLESHCCSLSQPSKCLYCNNKICVTCQRSPFWPGLTGRRHVNECAPYCEPCYYDSFARHPRGYKKPCKCYSTDRSNEFQDCCRSCMSKDVTELQAARHKRYQQEARDIAYRENLKCGLCKQVLMQGMRWWKCGKCSGECRDKIHPGVVRRKREKDVEKGREEDGQVSVNVTWWRKWRNRMFSGRGVL